MNPKKWAPLDYVGAGIGIAGGFWWYGDASSLAGPIVLFLLGLAIVVYSHFQKRRAEQQAADDLAARLRAQRHDKDSASSE